MCDQNWFYHFSGYRKNTETQRHLPWRFAESRFMLSGQAILFIHNWGTLERVAVYTGILPESSSMSSSPSGSLELDSIWSMLGSSIWVPFKPALLSVQNSLWASQGHMVSHCCNDGQARDPGSDLAWHFSWDRMPPAQLPRTGLTGNTGTESTFYFEWNMSTSLWRS